MASMSSSILSADSREMIPSGSQIAEPLTTCPRPQVVCSHMKLISAHGMVRRQRVRGPPPRPATSESGVDRSVTRSC